MSDYLEAMKLTKFSFGALITKALYTHTTNMNHKLLELTFKDKQFSSEEVHEANLVPQHSFDVLLMAAVMIANKEQFKSLIASFSQIIRKTKHTVNRTFKTY